MARRIPPIAPVVPLDLWRQLCRAASEFQLLAPWRWMDDTHVLGINSSHGVRLVSVMGNLGEVFGLASYRGDAGTNFLIRLLRGEFPPETSESPYYQDGLLVDFVPWSELRKEDRRIMGEIDFHPAACKPKRFPKFSSYRPGFVPWFLDESEARQLLEDFQKILRFATLVQSHPDQFESRRSNEFPFYPSTVKAPLALDQFEWHVVTPVPTPADPPVALPAAEQSDLRKTRSASGADWELSAFYSQSSVSEPPRPYWPKLGLCVDAHIGLVLGHQLGTPRETMAEVAVGSLKRAIEAAGYRPATIKVNSVNLLQSLGPIAGVLELKLLQAKSLPMLNEARRALEAHARQS